MAQGNLDFAYDTLLSLPEEESDPPQPLLSSESLEWDAIANLDDFFRRIYRYYEEKGFETILVSRVLNLLALGFTIAFSAFLLLFVRWHALHSECIVKDTCDISQVAFEPHPLKDGLTMWNALRVMYLGIFGTYWLYNLAHLFVDLREAAVIAHFTQHRLGLSRRQLKTVTWPEVARRIVDVQKQTRLCITRDLSEKDVVSRIMRKENYLIGMLNKGVLALNVTIPGLGKRFMLTKTLEWNLHWCILDAMLDDKFCIKEDFKHDVAKLQRRFRRVAIANLLLAPFLLVFLIIYFFMRNAEKFYHQPSSAGARRWSSLAAWRLREFNELPHYLGHRLNASHKAAEKYISQFPSPMLSHVAKFVAFIAGSFAALLLFVALMDDNLLERHLFGRNLVWWAATLGIVLAISRAFILEPGTAFEPELALLEVVAHTHWLPRHWRGRAHTSEVQQQFQQLFQFKALLFLGELASIVLTPFVLYFSLPKCAPAILAFVRDFSVHVPGVGDICSLATFDFERHGNPKYGSPSTAPKAARSRQGKMEKSFLSFAATYPTWEPDSAAKQMLLALGHAPSLRGAVPQGPADTDYIQSAIAASLFPGAPRYPAYHQISPYSVAAASSFQRMAMKSTPGLASFQGSIFGSAELTNAAASLTASHATEVEERVAAGQLLLQSFYEDRERTMRLGGLHHAPPGSSGRGPFMGGTPEAEDKSSAATRNLDIVSRAELGQAGYSQQQSQPAHLAGQGQAVQQKSVNPRGGPMPHQPSDNRGTQDAQFGPSAVDRSHKLPQQRQPPHASGPSRGGNGLLGRTGLFRGRTSSEREESPSSEMASFTRDAALRDARQQQQPARALDAAAANQDRGQLPVAGFRPAPAHQQHQAGEGHMGYHPSGLTPWCEESESQQDDFILDSQHEDSETDSQHAVHGIHPSHNHQGMELSQGGSGFLLDREYQQHEGLWNSHSDAGNGLQRQASGDLFEPLHGHMPGQRYPAAGPGVARTHSNSDGSGLTWHDNHSQHALDAFADSDDEPPPLQ